MINAYTDIDWSTWKPTEQATLMFVMTDDEVLLIRKKRGLGAGKINGPGGRLEAGESLEQCAIRETQEELGVTAINPRLMGRHRFQFADGYALEVFVYMTNQYTGDAIETDEAAPLWTPKSSIPYDEMWADDRIWMPIMFEGRYFDGRYLFDQDTLIDYELDNIERTDRLIAH